MTTFSDIPIQVDRPPQSGVDDASVAVVLTRLTQVIAEFLATGRPGVIDLRHVPHMQEATYQALKDALATGEVSAVVATESRVEVVETQYPGVWWITHRNDRGAIVTELIEVSRIPAILMAHPSEIRAGLQRLQRTLAESAPTTGRAAPGGPLGPVGTGDAESNTDAEQ